MISSNTVLPPPFSLVVESVDAMDLLKDMGPFGVMNDWFLSPSTNKGTSGRYNVRSPIL